MVPLKVFENGSIHELNSDDFCNGIIELCVKHRKEGRAIAFAFLLYDFCNPQIIKVLEYIDYWNALNTISGKLLSVYYLHSQDRIFAENLVAVDQVERRGLYSLDALSSIDSILPMLKKYLALDDNVKLPSIFFFQTEGKIISDYFLIELSEDHIEESFLELKNYIEAAVDKLEMIDSENYENYQPIFESL